ncbi:MAG: hypothetical protein SFV54_20445 [Bryobacteraceae bacterium]|nr:hypothetical protein [Bryobacteraceae bacterium]
MMEGPAAALLSLAAAFLPLAACYSAGRVLLRNTDRLPRAAALAAGAPVVSLAVFLLLLIGFASRWTLAAVCIAALVSWPFARWKPKAADTDRLVLSALAPLAVFYLVHAMAPEIQPDGITYHLGVIKEWLREGGFPERVTFYEILPLGMETLYAPAYALGGGAAAKLVHFGFLLATLPLIVDIGRRLGMSARAAWMSAGLYFAAPVTGIAGTSSYSDAGLVFFAVAVFDLILAGGPAGLPAGFCYAVKMSGGIVPVAALCFARRRLLFAAAVLLSVAPWVGRAIAWTGNPVAPLLNGVFPNPAFVPSTAEIWSYEIRWWEIPLELTLFGEKLNGMIGPAFLAAPLALLALRKPEGRRLLAAAALMALPWFANPGTRFLLPALPFLALALVLSVPARLAPALLVLQLAGAVVLDRPAAWRLRGLPWEAALGVETSGSYLSRELWQYQVAELVNSQAKPGDHLLDLVTAPWAYMQAVPVVPWQSRDGERLKAALELGAGTQGLTELRLEWTEAPLTGIRLEHRGTGEAWSVHGVELARRHEVVHLKRGWELDADPNPWESPYALDRNAATRWTTWAPAREGDFWEVRLPQPERLTAITITCYGRPLVEVLVQREDGSWRSAGKGYVEQLAPALNLRAAAARYLKSQGVRWVLTPTGKNGYGPLGEKLVDRKRDWGFAEAGSARNNVLLRLE